MDEKRGLYLPAARPNRKGRSIMLMLMLCFAAYTLWWTVSSPPAPVTQPHDSVVTRPSTSTSEVQKKLESDDAKNARGLVPLEAHIMSKCPDARVSEDIHRIIITSLQRREHNRRLT